MRKLIVLDRDGVINHDSDDFIKSVDEWRPIDGSIDAIARLNKVGFTVAVATNQSGIGRGLYSEATLAAIHDELRRQVITAGGRIDKIVYCPHLPDAGCDCRKPGSGLLNQLAESYDISLLDVPVIGDSKRDLESAVAVGARPVLVLTGNGRITQKSLHDLGEPVQTFVDLAGAADFFASTR